MKRTIRVGFCLFWLIFPALRGLAQQPDGLIRTVAGNGTNGASGDGGQATSAQLSGPVAVAVDGAGNLFIVDVNSDTVRQVTPGGVISTIAGNGIGGFSGDGGQATSAQLSQPWGAAVDAAGNIYIADFNNYRVRKVAPGGVISTVAGNGTRGFSGDGGQATSARLDGPMAVAVDISGNLYIADWQNQRVRKVTPGGVISTIAGNGTKGMGGDGGQATAAQLANPSGVAVDAAGNVYIADTEANRVRKVTPGGLISTVFGNVTGPLNHPQSVAVDAAGNVYISDSENDVVRKVTPSGVINTVAGTGTAGFGGDGGPASLAQLDRPLGIALDAAGGLFIADVGNRRVRKIGSRSKRDFNGDGKTDVLWRDTAGNVSMWLMNGTTITNSFFIGGVWTGWTIAGNGDFNGDGKADILWRDTAGNVSIWLMEGPTVTSYSNTANVSMAWVIAGVGDFNGDGKADILWRDSTGNVVIWLMNGHSIASSSLIANVWTGWAIAGSGDFNNDGKADILWRDTAGNVSIWLMDGFSVTGYGNPGNMETAWTVAAVGDFNGNGTADILWRHTDGLVSVWLMNGPAIANSGTFANVWTGWTIAASGDFNGDGDADILWRDNAGNVAIWLMNVTLLGSRGSNDFIISYRDMGNVSDRRAQ